jgi:hypothetical protein
MPSFVDRVKDRFHRDLAADPLTHGWVLNLYRAGERYPQRVCDYFQSEFAPTPELAADLTRHARDEDKHVTLFAHALKRIGQPVVELPIGDVFNEVIRSFTPGTFHIVAADPPAARRLKLAHFLAHAHHLEKRVARSFLYHLEACERAGQGDVSHIVAAVYKDESHHVSYTRDAVFELLPRRQAREVLALHRVAEARANLLFSARQVRGFLASFLATTPRHRRALYRLSADLMEGASHLVS